MHAVVQSDNEVRKVCIVNNFTDLFDCSSVLVISMLIKVSLQRMYNFGERSQNEAFCEVAVDLEMIQDLNLA